jgi:Ig-like domain from next to BRCA1 gene
LSRESERAQTRPEREALGNGGMTTRTEQPASFFRKAYAGARRRVEFGDALIFLYTLVLARQYFWILENNLLAWMLTIALAVVCWYFYVSTKQFPAEKFGRSFWLMVGLPLLVAYLLRAAFPDHSYDVWSYHLLHAERSLRGTLYRAGDFFPTALPFNPVADMLTGISNFFLGFRLGTVINLLALVWAAQIADKLLRPFIGRAWLRSACVLLVVLSENLLFEISTYMVDLLTLPLLLQATLLTLRADEAENRRANFVHVALLLGASTAFKFTNLAVALPLLAVCACKMVVGSRRVPSKQLMTTALLMFAGFLAPLLPFTLYIFRLTGNPIFPIANVFFKSPYWPTHGGWDDRWGPHSLWETIAWPVLIWFKPERHSELGVYSGRLSLGFIVAVAGLLLVWRNTRARTLCLILVSSSLLWSAAAMGYSRYGLYQDVLAGVIVLAVAAALIGKSSWRQFSWRTALALVLFAVLVVQASFACSYGLHKEWGGRTSFIANPDIYAQEAKLILRDHSIRTFLTDDESARFDSVQVWFETGPTSTGFEMLLNPRAPIIAVRQPEYFATRESWRQFIRTVEATPKQHMYSLCLNVDLPAAKQAIAERGLELGQLTPVELPFFSPRDRIGMMLIEVRIPQDPEARNQFESAWVKGAFAASDYREEIVSFDPPSVMHPGENLDIRFKVKNLGSATWPAVGTKDFRYQINMGDRWIRAGVTTEDNRAVMKDDLPPGGETEIKMTVRAPQMPGDYTLEIDMVHEGVTWFKEKGARPLLLPVRVQP